MAVLAAFPADIGHMAAIFANGFTAFLPNLGHMLAILTHGLAAFASGFASLL
jgi:hypothetical protein